MIKILPLFYKLTGIKAIKSKKIKDGITNINYRVITNNQDYVIRIPRKNIIGINRNNEKKVIDLIKPLNINVDIIYYNVSTGILISKYVKNKNKKQVDYKVVVSLIKKLHQLKCNEIEIFDPFKLIECYKKELEDTYFINEERIIIKAKEVYKKYPLVLCHNDLLYANCINSNNKNYLIDYEYSGKNIALFDIVSFLNENDIVDKQKQMEFIKLYYETIDTDLLNDIEVMFVFLDLLWGYWAYTMYKLYKDEVFLSIALNKQNRFNLKSCIY